MFSWRDDEQCGAGWHLPGGCVRLKETLEQRLHVCAKSELGTDVLCDMKPVLITENIEIGGEPILFRSFISVCL